MFSPFEQFKIFFLYEFNFGSYSVFLSNFTIYNLIVYLFFTIFFLSFYQNIFKKNIYNNIIENYYSFTYGALSNQVTKRGNRYIPFFQYIFLFITISNLLGMIPYSFSVTSHIAFVFGFSLAMFIGLQVIGFERFGLYFFSFFLPSGVPTFITPFIVILELISYSFRVVSLSVRLIANIVSGHMLLKLIMGFIYNMLMNGSFFLLAAISIALISALICLEFAIAILQAYVYLVLCAIYLKDVLTVDQH